MSTLPVLVIGGGVAGSACALELRRRGIEVHVAEKAIFPRAKVCGCCLGGAGLQALEQLSLRSWVVDCGVATRRWECSIAGRLVGLKLPTGVAISRQKLDTRMLDAARDEGVQVMAPCTASISAFSDDEVTVDLMSGGSLRQQRYAVAVIASGLTASGLQNVLPWKVTPHGPFGVAYSARSVLVETGVIYMACDEDGYVGLVKLEDGRVDIAAALAPGAAAAKRGHPSERVQSILARSQFPSWSLDDLSPLMTTPPLRRTRVAGVGRVLAIGDAAGYVEPFTGEGMTWAMQSGIAAASTIAELSGDLSAAGLVWNRRQGKLLRRQKLACRAVTQTLRFPLARRAAAWTLTSWPSLANPLLRSLNRGHSAE